MEGMVLEATEATEAMEVMEVMALEGMAPEALQVVAMEGMVLEATGPKHVKNSREVGVGMNEGMALVF